MQIFVKGLDGRTSTLDVSTDDSIRHVKRLACGKTGVHPTSQRLLALGKPLLGETRSLGEYGVRDGCTLHLSCRLRGGCLPHSLKLYLRCLHLFKCFISLYMFISGCVMVSDYSIHQAYGSQFVLYGLMVLLLSITKPCNIVMGHYGSVNHNKFALLVIIAFDSTVIFLQSSLAIIFIVSGTEEFEKQLRKDCSRAVLPEDSIYSTQECKEFWDSDRTAGFRLAWMSTYYMGMREGDATKQQLLEEVQAEGMCCGFGPPTNCVFIENKEEFPTHLKQDEYLGNDMLQQRVKCSGAFEQWYPEQLGICSHYDESDFKEENSLGCKFDWANGMCLDRGVNDYSLGCAQFYEDWMNDKLYPQGVILFGSIILEGFTVIAACFYCWKRKENDVLPVTYIYEEPWDPIKEGKLKLHEPQDAAQHGEED